jgi:hypothetical protein
MPMLTNRGSVVVASDLRRTSLRFCAALGLLTAAACGSQQAALPPDLDALLDGLSSAARVDYTAEKDGGLAHSTYFSIKVGSAEHSALPKSEQEKLVKIQSGVLHSQKLPPTDLIAGTEITGTLLVKDAEGERKQEVVLKVPAQWNGQLVVVGNTRNAHRVCQ